VSKTNLEGSANLAELAREYYVKGMSQRDIAKARNVKQSTVSIWLQRARDRGVVLIDIDAEFAITGIEHRDKSKELRDAFGLREALVVDPGRPEVFEDERANELHTIIANTTGVRLREWIQAGDHVVVGGGRAPVKVARVIKRTPPSRREVRISPLSGRIWTGSWQEDGPENLQRPLDADDAARLLAFAFEHEPGTRFGQIGHPLFEEPDLVKQTIEEECVFSPGGQWNTTWGLQPPGKALVGVGVLHPRSGHRIAELLNKIELNPKDKVARHLKWAASQFAKAMDFVTKNGLPFFGDVANRQFPALLLPTELQKSAIPVEKLDELYSELGCKLDVLNSRAVVMDWDHLRCIPSVWAVAGGALKINVLWTLLICRFLDPDKSKSVVKEVSTDIRTANQLLEALQAFHQAPTAFKNWYRSIAPRIFGPSSKSVEGRKGFRH
jgi:DNA-binding transcriptional regulator LsrR (DeoR family)